MIRAAGFVEVIVGVPMLFWGGLTHNVIFLTGGIASAMCGAYAVHTTQPDREEGDR